MNDRKAPNKGWVGDRCMTDRDIAELDKRLGAGAPKKKKPNRPKPVKRDKKKQKDFGSSGRNRGRIS